MRFLPLVTALPLLLCCQPKTPDKEKSCSLGKPQIGDTPQSKALANAPARCGAPDYKWLRSDQLGTVVEYGKHYEFDPALLEFAALMAGVTLPQPPIYNVAADHIRYTTQDRGQLVEATAMIAYPTNLPADTTLDFLLFLHGTSGFMDDCAPSNEESAPSLIGVFASMGRIVVAPDYIGLKAFGEPTGFLHPYLVGEATAIASLDAVRAAAKVANQNNYCVGPRLAFLGGSQGGHAALWVDRLQPYYGAEFELLGGVATVPPSDLTAQLEKALLNLIPASGNTVSFLATAAGWYGIEDQLDEIFLSSLDPSVPDILGAGCDASAWADQVDELADVFQQDLLEAATSGNFASYTPWSCITDENSLTKTSIKRIVPKSDSYGIQFVLGEMDELVDTPIEIESFRTLCQEQEMPLSFLSCSGAGHVDATLWAMPEILNYVDDRFAGKKATPLCTVETPVECSATPQE